jgi:hypothetical protein
LKSIVPCRRDEWMRSWRRKVDKIWLEEIESFSFFINELFFL